MDSEGIDIILGLGLGSFVGEGFGYVGGGEFDNLGY